MSPATLQRPGRPPAAGRLIDAMDDRDGAPLAAVVSYGYAQRRFGDRAQAIGQKMLIDGGSFHDRRSHGT